MVAIFKARRGDTGLDLASCARSPDIARTGAKSTMPSKSNFAGVDTNVLTFQIPGGMFSNLASQLREQNALDKLPEVLDEVPRVRAELGYPPLVTPSSQFVGTQATLNVITGERYKVITTEIKNYFLGLYGRAPGHVDRDIMARAIGDEEPIKTRPADRLDPELDAVIKDLPPSAETVEDQLSFVLFPAIARDFFEAREKGDLVPEPLEMTPAKGPAVAGELHLAPVEFNVTVHGETYHVKVSGSGRKDRRTQTLLHPCQQQARGGLARSHSGSVGGRA